MQPSEMSRAAFVEKFGGVFEHSPWIAERAWDSGLPASCDTAIGLHRTLCVIVRAASEGAKLNLLRAHPDLAGKLALAGGLAENSAREQAGAGLDRLSPEELARFQSLNARYMKRFDFPFIIAVRGKTKDGILRAFERRLANDPATERATALEQVEQIALLRLRDLLP